MRVGTHNGHLMVAALKRHRDKPVIHLGDDDADRRRGRAADQPVRPGLRGARRRPGHRGRAARAEPARGAVHPRRQPDPGLPAYVAAPARLARRPRLRHQRRRDHHPDRRPAVRRARGRPAREVPGPQAGAHDRAGARRARPRRQGPGRGGRRLRAAAARGGRAAAGPHRPRSPTPAARPASPRASSGWPSRSRR